MLRAVEPGPSVVVCSTCRLSAEQREDEGGRRGGAVLADAMRQVQSAEPELGHIAIQEMPCLSHASVTARCISAHRAASAMCWVTLRPMKHPRAPCSNIRRCTCRAKKASCLMASGHRA